MKGIKLLFLLFCLSILQWACKKNYADSLPAVQFVSVIPYGQDSAIITGKVTIPGVGDIQYVGFSYNTQPNADIVSNQVLLNGTNGAFSAIVRAYQDSTYYYKCFAANNFGYVVSTPFKYTVPIAKPDSAPCSLTANMVTDNNVNHSVPYIYTGWSYAAFGAFGIQATDGAFETINIYFKTIPANGIYTTQLNQGYFPSDNNPYEVVINVNSNFNVNPGQNVYVAIYPSGSTSVSFCDITYAFNSNTNIILSGKILY